MEQDQSQPDLAAILAQMEQLQATVARMEARYAAPMAVLGMEPTADTVIYHRSIQDTILALLTSRKFLLLLLDTIISLTMHYNAAPPEIIAIIQPVFVMLIYAIAKEDAAEKGATRNIQIQGTSAPNATEG